MSRVVCPKRAPLSWNVILPRINRQTVSRRGAAFISVWLGSTRYVNFSYTVIDELLLPLSLTKSALQACQPTLPKRRDYPQATNSKPQVRTSRETQQLAQNKNVDLSGRGVHWGLYETKKEG